MTTKSNEKFSENSYQGPPIYFADQLAALMLNPVISRITFGIDEMDGSQFPRPTVTVAIPTTALLQFVNDIKAALEDSAFKKLSVEQLELAAHLIKTGGETSSASEKVEVKRSAKLTHKS